VVAAISGIGKVAAATTATLMLERFGVSMVLFTGVAGGLGTGVSVGDVVVASELLQHDMDASPLFPRHEVPGYGRTRFATDGRWRAALLHAAQHALDRVGQVLGPQAVADFGLQKARVHEGLVVSGDRFVATTAESHALRQALPDALAVEMEGAAVAQVCHDFGVPFALVRTVSDRADDDAHVDFVRFVNEVASAFSAHIVRETLTHASA
jgi:adenosylhomocysteine nucleosidase